ncbi:APC family permease [Kineococcus glutinatus]|uniref:APC family permease n=1 Tax=Kineococcus glutinatus TaxID=1070872 RepID=A0ABP9H6U7_9ACTN
MSSDVAAGAAEGTAPAGPGVSGKGLRSGVVGLVGSVVVGIACIAPAYTLTGALGPTVAEVGPQLPAIFLAGFVPMLLVALGYRELNAAMPDSGTSFTWGVRAFGPWVGWLAGWGLLVANVVVLSNLAAVAVDFFYLLLSQLFSSPAVADLTANPVVNVATCVVFVALATLVSYRGVESQQRLQHVLVGFQVLALLLFAGAALWRVADGSAFDATEVQLSWFDPTAVPTFSAFAAGLSLSIFIFWGWDVVLTMSEETKGARATPGRAATVTVVLIAALYLVVAVATISFAGLGEEGIGLANADIQGNVFVALGGPVLGPLAVLMSLAVLVSSASSLQSTFVSPARTLLAMGHYGAISPRFAGISRRFRTPGYATIAAGVITSVFYVAMHLLSQAVLWDTIATLGMMICFYYGLTAFACVWYFRGRWFASARDLVVTLLAPGAGGLILAALFVTTLLDSRDPAYGSGTELFGLGLVFVLGVGLLLLGVVLMLLTARRRPGFFRGEGLRRGVAGEPAPVPSPEELP